jgi:hypothetical protein
MKSPSKPFPNISKFQPFNELVGGFAGFVCTTKTDVKAQRQHVKATKFFAKCSKRIRNYQLSKKQFNGHLVQ